MIDEVATASTMSDNMDMLETYRGVVYPHHLDHMGHMNVQWYAAKFDEATWHLVSAIGITAKFLEKNNRGMAALEQTTRFKAEVRSGDLLIIKSKITGIKEKTIRFLHVMYNAESMHEAASCELLGIYMDTQIRKSCPFPEDIIDNCKRLIETGN